MQNFTNLWLAYELTGSPFYLGLVGGTLAASTIVFSLFGGVLADRFDRRRVLLFTQSSLGLLTLILAILVTLNIVTIWHILVIASISGMVQAFDRPSRESLIPHLVDDKKDLINAVALSSTVWQMTRIMGPAAAGIIIGFSGASLSFYISSFLYFSLMIAVMQVKLPARIKTAERSNMWKSLAEGLAYIWRNGFFRAILGMTFINSVFGTSYLFLMPVFTKDILKAGPEGFGFIMTGIGVGGLMGTLTAAFLGRMKHKYLLFIGSSIASGAFIIVFAHSNIYMVSLAAGWAAALATNVYMVLGQVFLQTLVPDDLRGRTMSIYGLVWSLTPMGSLQSGAIATYLGAPVAVTIGASVLVAFSLSVFAFTPGLRKLKM